MFPKNTVNPPVDMPVQKPPSVAVVKKDTAVNLLYVVDNEQRVSYR